MRSECANESGKIRRVLAPWPNLDADFTANELSVVAPSYILCLISNQKVSKGARFVLLY